MNNILLTGGSGFFGRYLKKELSKYGKVITIGISENDDVFFDLSKGIPLLDNTYALVVHAAGKAHVIPRTGEDERSFYDVNHKGTVNLLKAFDRKGLYPERFVFISTVAVYGLESGININENASLKAVDAYGRSKILAEKEVLEWGKKNNVLITILRLPLLIGKNAPGNLGAMITAIKKGRFAIIGKGNTKRSMVFAGDVSGFIPEISRIGGIYNLTDGYHPAYKELAEAIGGILNKKPYWVIPNSFAVIMAKTADIIQRLSGKDLPFSSRRLEKLTTSLTFDDSKARTKGWKPHKVLDIASEWA
jgi:nucleoside-diphosphate-sugar epimerase